MKLLAVLALALSLMGCVGRAPEVPPAPTTTTVAGPAVKEIRTAPPVQPRNPASCTGTVALTFDDGPGIYTPQVLALLKRWHARATFFMVGERVHARPEMVKAALADGHWLANHTWDHPHLSELSTAHQRAQIEHTSQALVAAGAPKPKLFRAPFGDSTAEERAYVNAQGMRQVLWTVDPEDWKGSSPAHIRSWTLGHLRDGAVVLLHDGTDDTPPNTLKALPAIIDGLRARGLCTGPIPADAPEKWGDPGAAGAGAHEATTTTTGGNS